MIEHRFSNTCHSQSLRYVYRTIILVCLIVANATANAADMVFFSGGNVLIGELKYMERGRLFFKTDATGTIGIEWDEIERLTSDQQLRLELVDGNRYFGSIGATDSGQRALVDARRGKLSVDLKQVVSIQPFEEEFWERFSGNVSAGYNFTKSSDVTQFNFGARMQYQTDNWRSGVEVNSIITEDSDQETTNRSSLNINTRRLRGKHWATGAFTSFERNDGQGVDLRSSVGGILEHYLINNNTQRLALNGGLLYSHESIIDSSDSNDSIEALFNVAYEIFRYDSPELDLASQLSVIPNLTDWGRVRSELDITLKWEVYEDLFWQLTFYNSYDNRPPTEDAANSDYGVITGVTLEF